MKQVILLAQFLIHALLFSAQLSLSLSVSVSLSLAKEFHAQIKVTAL